VRSRRRRGQPFEWSTSGKRPTIESTTAFASRPGAVVVCLRGDDLFDGASRQRGPGELGDAGIGTLTRLLIEGLVQCSPAQELDQVRLDDPSKRGVRHLQPVKGTPAVRSACTNERTRTTSRPHMSHNAAPRSWAVAAGPAFSQSMIASAPPSEKKTFSRRTSRWQIFLSVWTGRSTQESSEDVGVSLGGRRQKRQDLFDGPQAPHGIEPVDAAQFTTSHKGKRTNRSSETERCADGTDVHDHRLISRSCARSAISPSRYCEQCRSSGGGGR